MDQLMPGFPPITIATMDTTTNMPAEQGHKQGITHGQAAVRLHEYGPNELPERKPPGLLRIFTCQFKSPFVYVLFAAAVVSWGLGQTINSFFIFVVLLINALIGTIQEYSAERA
ncbi:MAG: cation-transporting P-type ATPase, partial [Pseudomonadota bacterium]